MSMSERPDDFRFLNPNSVRILMCLVRFRCMWAYMESYIIWSKLELSMPLHKKTNRLH